MFLLQASWPSQEELCAVSAVVSEKGQGSSIIEFSAIPASMSMSAGASNANKGSASQIGLDTVKRNRTVGQQRFIKAKIGDIDVNCLVDTGSQVTLIREDFFKKYLQPKMTVEDGG